MESKQKGKLRSNEPCNINIFTVAKKLLPIFSPARGQLVGVCRSLSEMLTFPLSETKPYLLTFTATATTNADSQPNDAIASVQRRLGLETEKNDELKLSE